MSSHHVIRDEQEPPILAFQLNDNWEELSELLGWSPILLIDPLLREVFELRQTKVDGFLWKDKPECPPKKSDLSYRSGFLAQSLLSWIATKNYTAINMFCDFEIMLHIFSAFKGENLMIPFIFFTEEGKFILKAESIYKKWYPAGFTLKLLNLDVKNTQNLKLEEGKYKVEKDGFVLIEVEGDLILVNESI